MRRAYTRELRAAQAAGARIVCSLAPYEGHEVVHRPRFTADPKPWVPVDMAPGCEWYRLNGRECHAVHPQTTADEA